MPAPMWSRVNPAALLGGCTITFLERMLILGRGWERGLLLLKTLETP